MNNINYVELGATLFVPCTHNNLEDIVCNNKYPELKSILIDTEDGILEDDLESAYEAIESLLNVYEKKSLLVFIRPKNVDVLTRLLRIKNIENVDGFILPKFSLINAQQYFDVLENSSFYLMPSIEGKELFNQSKLYELREIILKNRKNILLLRFGLEDILRQLRMKRSCENSIFDYSATSYVVAGFIATFKSAGFAISGGVYPCFKDDEGFIKDMKRDLKEGLFSKTIIHPNQIKLSNELYKVTKKELDNALEISKSQKAIFNQNNKMAEVITMKPHSEDIILRAEIYGLI